ncbi:hypothetical protein K2173_027547 [Erythroxylum novogranatense]|uniref:BHLH domain-containing protein n=1 Tax=Erythroxylum novogranatense TaxID=1862640 RepID=A0AAV8U1W9_9ROSI|nr:hypothetical protein K2173_027547 [Erythroxylum novogranatense]
MELDEQSYLDELLAIRRENWETIPGFSMEMSELFDSSWNYDGVNDNPTTLPQNSLCDRASTLQQDFNNYYFNEVHGCPFGYEFSGSQFTDEFSVPQFTDSSHNTLETPPFPLQENTPMSIMENEEHGLTTVNGCHDLEMEANFKVEPTQSPEPEVPFVDVGSCPERKIRGKRVDGQPSKNLMAERRRRKRLNDRLSMLRSIVPKISKMDRTSILGDTIDYMKELLERINVLEQEIQVDSDDLNLKDTFKDMKGSESIVRNSPKFDVERRNMDTKIEIFCTGKPGLLLSTVKTLEALGVEIEQCVISCFNEFAMQASCSEDLEHRALISPEDIKQALFASAGYGGRCV